MAWLELPALVRVIHALELAGASLYGTFVEILKSLAALDDFRNRLVREAA